MSPCFFAKVSLKKNATFCRFVLFVLFVWMKHLPSYLNIAMDVQQVSCVQVSMYCSSMLFELLELILYLSPYLIE